MDIKEGMEIFKELADGTFSDMLKLSDESKKKIATLIYEKEVAVEDYKYATVRFYELDSKYQKLKKEDKFASERIEEEMGRVNELQDIVAKSIRERDALKAELEKFKTENEKLLAEKVQLKKDIQTRDKMMDDMSGKIVQLKKDLEEVVLVAKRFHEIVHGSKPGNTTPSELKYCTCELWNLLSRFPVAPSGQQDKQVTK